MLTFRVLSVLLQYPSAEIIAHREEMARLLREENLLPRDHLRAVEAFLHDLGGRDTMDVEAEYVETFDRTRSLSLHLFEHIHGESRDRGQAMVDLLGHYRRSGLELACSELPDYLPLFLEFLGTRPTAEARILLSEVVDIVALIAERLRQRGSPYARVCSAVAALSAVQPDRAALAAEMEGEKPAAPDVPTGVGLDADWEEPPVMFGAAGADGGDAAACPLARDAVARMNAGR